MNSRILDVHAIWQLVFHQVISMFGQTGLNYQFCTGVINQIFKDTFTEIFCQVRTF